MLTHASYGNTFNLPTSGRMLIPFEKDAFITSLPVYCGSYPQALGLQYLLRFLDEDYFMAVRACPSTQQQSASNTILSQQSYEDQISVPAGSFLTMIAGFATEVFEPRVGAVDNAGFRVRLYDAGAQDEVNEGYLHSVCMSGRYVPNPTTNGGFIPGNTAAGNGLFNGLHILTSPFAVSSPGQLNVQITNLSVNTASIEMAFFFACPAGHMKETGSAAVPNPVTRW